MKNNTRLERLLQMMMNVGRINADIANILDK